MVGHQVQADVKLPVCVGAAGVRKAAFVAMQHGHVGVGHGQPGGGVEGRQRQALRRRLGRQHHVGAVHPLGVERPGAYAVAHGHVVASGLWGGNLGVDGARGQAAELRQGDGVDAQRAAGVAACAAVGVAGKDEHEGRVGIAIFEPHGHRRAGARRALEGGAQAGADYHLHCGGHGGRRGAHGQRAVGQAQGAAGGGVVEARAQQAERVPVQPDGACRVVERQGVDGRPQAVDAVGAKVGGLCACLGVGCQSQHQQAAALVAMPCSVGNQAHGGFAERVGPGHALMRGAPLHHLVPEGVDEREASVDE